ncbi:MAG: metallopeptidase family protein [Parcubacteria group bacterium]|nr:metallopeptidase family protein [Parcubacteria group bacterium]
MDSNIVPPQYFEKLVSQGIASIPEKFRRLLDNVAVVTAEEPTREQLRKGRTPRGTTLFGLYEGVPQTKRGPHYGAVLPDKITIFRVPIVEYAQNEEEVAAIVRDTVWHEIAHHFGIDEQRVREIEKLRRKRVSH